MWVTGLNLKNDFVEIMGTNAHTFPFTIFTSRWMDEINKKHTTIERSLLIENPDCHMATLSPFLPHVKQIELSLYIHCVHCERKVSFMT